MTFSSRSAIEDSPSWLASALDSARERDPKCIDLTLSNPTRADLSYQAYASLEDRAFDAPVYAPDPLGVRGAREAVARHWPSPGRAPDPDHVLLLPSSSEAYHYIFTLLCDVGDEVLAPEPSYPLLQHLARYAGVKLTPYQLSYDGAWHIDMASVRRAQGPRSRAIVLISPNNPTGSYTSQLELEQLATLGLPLVSDEVFAHYDLQRARGKPKSALYATSALTFCIDGLSKSAGLPQLKLSWLAVSGEPATVQQSMLRLAWISDTYLSVATPVQLALPELLERAPQFRGALLERLRNNLATLQRGLSGSAASVLRAEGGWYAILRMPDVASEDEWVSGLLERHGVLTHPGYFYDFSSRLPHLVLSLLVPSPGFQTGVEAICREIERRLLRG